MGDSKEIIESLYKLFARNKKVDVRIGLHDSKSYCERAGTVYYIENGNIIEADLADFSRKFPGLYQQIKWIDS